MLSLILLLSVLTDSPDQMMNVVVDFEKLDCAKMVDSAMTQCKRGCSDMKGKQNRKDCLSTCDKTLGSLADNCKQLNKHMKDFKSKSKDEQKKILLEASEADHHHRH